jgi:hypothetical protein
MAIVANIKNEGLLLCAIYLFCLMCFSLIKRKNFAVNPRPADYLRSVLWALAAACPGVMWLLFRIRMDLTNNLNLGISSWDKINMRVGSLEAVKAISAHLFVDCKTHLAVAMVLAIYGFAFSKRIPVSSRHFLPIYAASLYFAGIFLVYLSTPYDLMWHLETSADRVLMSFAAIMSAAAFLILREIEDKTAWFK